MLEVLKFIEILISFLLIFIVLLQNRSVSLNLTDMSSGMNKIQKRGADKILYNATIILGSAFIMNSIALYII